MLKHDKIFSLILSLILTISIMTLIFNISLKQNVFNVAWYKTTASNKGLNKEIKDKVEEKLMLVTIESAFPEDLYQNIVTEDIVNNTIDKILEENVKALSRESYNKDVLNADNILNAYNKRIDDYIELRNVIMDDDAQRVIADIKLKARTEVLAAFSSINFWTFLENHKNSSALNLLLSSSVLSGTSITMISIVMIFLSTILIFVINKNQLSFFFKYVGLAFFIGGVIPFSLGVGGNLSKISYNILFMGRNANKLLTELINSVFDVLTLYGIVFVIMGTLGVIISSTVSVRRSRSLGRSVI